MGHDLNAQGQDVGAQGHEAAVGGVAQGVAQSPRPISGAAEEGNSGSHAKAFPLGGFTYPAFIVSRKILLCQWEEIDFGLIGSPIQHKRVLCRQLEVWQGLEL